MARSATTHLSSFDGALARSLLFHDLWLCMASHLGNHVGPLVFKHIIRPRDNPLTIQVASRARYCVLPVQQPHYHRLDPSASHTPQTCKHERLVYLINGVELLPRIDRTSVVDALSSPMRFMFPYTSPSLA